MNKNLTELVFVLDRSGSMSGLETDTIGGFNAMIDKQRREAGDTAVTTVLFDDTVNVLYSREDIRNVRKLTEREYFAGGSTALLDAVGSTIERVLSQHVDLREEALPAHTIVVITTDGAENSSRRYSLNDVQRMISSCQCEHGWEFLFLGANMDAIAAASDLGIRADRAADVHTDSVGTAVTYASVASAISMMRSCAAPMQAEWKRDIETDNARREKTARKQRRQR